MFQKIIDFIPLIICIIMIISLFIFKQQKIEDNKNIKQQLIEYGIRVH